MSTDTEFRSFDEFYRFYLGEHSNRTCRRLHFIGSSLGLLLLAVALYLGSAGLAVIALVQGYAWAWVGHFFFEHNKPATFKYPWLSFKGDWKMWWQMLTGKVAI